jgi:heme-degrading monooxygenase HmoA
MFIPSNRFHVGKGYGAVFAQIWLSRDSYLGKVPGFVW